MHERRWKTRGGVFAAGAAALLLWMGDVQGASEPPTAAIRGTIGQVTRILEDETMKQPGQLLQRRRLLEDVIGSRFSYEEMSKRTLTAQWNRLNDEERREFIGLFQSLLSDRYADKIEGYAGEKIQYLAERIEGPYAEVRTRLVSDKLEVPMDYRLLLVAGDWRVYDVVIDGVSLVRNYRGQFEKIIRESSYAELLRRLRERTRESGAKESLG